MAFPTILNATDYFKFLFKIHYWKCTDKNEVSNHTTTIGEPENLTSWGDTAHWLVSAISESVKQYLPPPTPSQDTMNLKPDFIDPCGKPFEFEYECRLYPLFSTVYLLIFFLTIFICFVISRVVKRCLKRGEQSSIREIEKQRNSADDEDLTDEDELSAFRPKHSLNHSNLEASSNSNIEELTNIKSLVTMKNDRILLQYQMFMDIPSHINVKPKQVPVLTFLKHTTDYLFSMMDKLLLESARSPARSSPTRSVSDLGIGPTYNSLNTTPRRPLRRSGHRSRGSSPHLPEQDDHSTDPLEKRAWEELIQNIAMNNHVPFDFDVDLNMSISGDITNKKLLQFYLNHGSIKIEQLQVANLIVNYTLYLLTKEIDMESSVSGIQFEDFTLTGSIKKGLKVSQANQFDFYMNFHGTDFHVYEIFDQQKFDEIPPGKIVLRAKQKQICTESKCLKTIQINQRNHICVSSKSVSFTAEEIIDRALQNLYTGTRSLIDRLPFRIQRSPTANIVLSIDTRNVIGLGLSEIKIQLIPAIFLPISGWFQPVSVYATACSSSQQDYKSKSSRGQDPVPVPLQQSEFIWSLDLGSLEELFLKETDRKMKSAGIHGCHRTCIKILKVLFTATTRKSLLDRGQLSSCMIETVLFYLLLESNPDQWSFNLISDRISDAYLYLKRALETGRLPSFFISNPHLIKHMPFLNTYPFLLRGKQHNLLSDSRLETVDKKLNYMQDRIKDHGLEDCFKDSYSADTWEYEFFVYS